MRSEGCVLDQSIVCCTHESANPASTRFVMKNRESCAAKEAFICENRVGLFGLTFRRVISSLSCDSFSLFSSMAGVPRLCALHIVLLVFCRCTFSSTT